MVIPFSKKTDSGHYSCMSKGIEWIQMNTRAFLTIDEIKQNKMGHSLAKLSQFYYKNFIESGKSNWNKKLIENLVKLRLGLIMMGNIRYAPNIKFKLYLKSEVEKISLYISKVTTKGTNYDIRILYFTFWNLDICKRSKSLWESLLYFFFYAI